jgi:hypothetical protein
VTIGRVEEGFTLHPLGGDGPVITPVSKIVFGQAAVLLFAVESVRVRRRATAAAAAASEPAVAS